MSMRRRKSFSAGPARPRWPRRVAALVLVVCLGASVAWWLHGAAVVEPWTWRKLPATWSMRARAEVAARNTGSKRRVRHTFVRRPGIAVEMQLAAVAGEDIGFFGHGAVDLSAVREALGEWLQGERLRGASTISQQLAKNLFLSERRSLWRKLDELRLAWWLERRLGKRRILELYLNVIELGNGIYGVEAAAKHYYGTAAAALTEEQAAGLAASIPSPRRHNPETASASWKVRRDAILRRLDVAGKLRGRLAP